MQSVSRKKAFANTSEVVNEQGNRITTRYDDLSADITVELIPKGTYCKPEPGQSLTYKTIKSLSKALMISGRRRALCATR